MACYFLGHVVTCVLSLLWILGCERCMGRMVLQEKLENSFECILREMTRDILRGYFRNFKCVATISDTPYAVSDSGTSVTSTVNVVLDGAAGSSEHLLVSALDADCQGFVVRCADASAAVDLLLTAMRRAVRRVNLRLLLLPTNRTHVINATDVFALEDMKLVPDVLVARKVHQTESFELVTLRYTGAEAWRDELRVAYWQPGVGLEPPFSDPFPRRLSDLEGRQLVFATFHYPPYAVLEGGPGTPDGTETRIAIEFSNKVNASWLVTGYNEDTWGVIWDNNGSGYGVLGAVATRSADAAFAAIFQWLHEYLFLDFSRPYVRSGVTCLAPRPLVRSGWQVPLLPFSPHMWIAVAISVLLSTLALFATKMATAWVLESEGPATGERYSTVEDCFFRAVGLLVLQASDVERRHTRVVGPMRHVLSWLLITYLLITSSYGGGLSSVLTVPRYDPPIDTVSELHQSGLEWAETSIAWLFSLRERTEDVFRDLRRRFRVLTLDELHARTRTRNLAFPLERLPSGVYTIGKHIDEEAASRYLRPMREDMYWEYVVFAVPKGWPHIRQLDELIYRLYEGGIIQAWETQVARKWMAPRVQLAAQLGLRSYAQAPDGPINLQLTHVQGEFALLVLGLCLALVVFLLEIVVHWKTTKATAGLNDRPAAKLKAWEHHAKQRGGSELLSTILGTDHRYTTTL